MEVASLKEPQRFAKCDTRSSEARDQKPHSRVPGWPGSPRQGVCHQTDAAGLGHDWVSLPPLSVAFGFGLRGGYGFHSSV